MANTASANPVPQSADYPPRDGVRRTHQVGCLNAGPRWCCRAESYYQAAALYAITVRAASENDPALIAELPYAPESLLQPTPAQTPDHRNEHLTTLLWRQLDQTFPGAGVT